MKKALKELCSLENPHFIEIDIDRETPIKEPAFTQMLREDALFPQEQQATSIPLSASLSDQTEPSPLGSLADSPALAWKVEVDSQPLTMGVDLDEEKLKDVSSPLIELADLSFKNSFFSSSHQEKYEVLDNQDHPELKKISESSKKPTQ